MNAEQTRIATALSAYGIRKHFLRFTAHRVSFASEVAARLARRHREGIEQSLPGWVLEELDDPSHASRTVLTRASTVHPAELDDQADEADEETWPLTAGEVRPGMTIRLADRSRANRPLATWQRIVRIKHDRDGYLWFIGAGDEVLGRWGPGTRFERQPEQPIPGTGVATGRLDSPRGDELTVWKYRRTKRR